MVREISYKEQSNQFLAKSDNGNYFPTLNLKKLDISAFNVVGSNKEPYLLYMILKKNI